jgi:hypothetical protein
MLAIILTTNLHPPAIPVTTRTTRTSQKPSAFDVAPRDTGLQIVPKTLTAPNAPSLSIGRIAASYPKLEKSFVSGTTSAAHVTTPDPSIPSIHAPSAATQTMAHPAAPVTDIKSILYSIPTPYKPEGWRRALHKAGITHLFPNLVHNLTYSSPIGSPPPLTYFFTTNNLASANLNPDYISKERRSNGWPLFC